MKIKLKTIQNTENESDDEEDKSIIKVEENRVYFHADVTRENCIKLIESLQKAQEYIAIRNIKNEFEEIGNIYLYIFSDGDVYGEHIAMVIVSGSANAAHLRDLAVPEAKWLGIWGSDIIKYKLPSIPLTDIDLKRIHDLKKDPRYAGGLWRKELNVFQKIKKKCELEAFSKYGLTAITDTYLPEKLEEAKSM